MVCHTPFDPSESSTCPDVPPEGNVPLAVELTHAYSVLPGPYRVRTCPAEPAGRTSLHSKFAKLLPDKVPVRVVVRTCPAVVVLLLIGNHVGFPSTEKNRKVASGDVLGTKYLVSHKYSLAPGPVRVSTCPAEPSGRTLLHSKFAKLSPDKVPVRVVVRTCPAVVVLLLIGNHVGFPSTEKNRKIIFEAESGTNFLVLQTAFLSPDEVSTCPKVPISYWYFQEISLSFGPVLYTI